MTSEEEAAYILGRKAVLRRLLMTCASELGFDDPLARAAALIDERAAAIVQLRKVCAEHGSNEWPDNLYLADIIDKNLARHLGG